MANRRDFFFKQKVTEAEMDEAFNDMEVAERAIITDLSFTGIINNGVVTESTPTPDLNVLVTGPMLGRTPLGERISFAPNLTVDLSLDGDVPEGGGGSGNGVSTAVSTGGQEKWVSLFMVFDRNLSDPRTDGLGNSVFYDRLESFHFTIVQSAEFAAPIGIGNAPATPGGAIRLADVRFTFSMTQIFNANIVTTNRDDVIFADAAKISVVDNFPSIFNSVTNVQETLEELGAADQNVSGLLLIGRASAPTAAFALEVDAVSPELIHLHDPSTELVAGGGTGLHLNFTSGTGHVLISDIVDLDSLSLSVEDVIAPPTQGKGHIRADMYSGHIAAGQVTPKMHLLATGSAPRVIDFFSGAVAAKVYDTQIKVGELETQLSGGITALLGDIVATAGDVKATAGSIEATAGDILAIAGKVSGEGFEPTDDVRNVTLSATQAPRISEGQQNGTVARVDAAGALVGANDVNVVSITDNGTGDHTVNFDRSHSDANYIVHVNLDGGGAGMIAVGTVAAGSVQILTFDSSGVAADRAFHLTTVGVLV